MRAYLLLLSAVCILTSGCCSQLAETASTELPICMDKCFELCDAAKEQNISLEGYTQVGLSKSSGGVSVSCNCPCIY